MASSRLSLSSRVQQGSHLRRKTVESSLCSRASSNDGSLFDKDFGGKALAYQSLMTLSCSSYPASDLHRTTMEVLQGSSVDSPEGALFDQNESCGQG